MPSILVTGATGFIGSHLCKRLVGEGHEVIGLSLSGDKSRLGELKEDNFSLRIGDIRNDKRIESIFQHDDIKTVFHLASQVPYSSYKSDFHNINGNGTFNLVDLSQRYGVERFIYASSMSVYSVPPSKVLVSEDSPTKPEDDYGKTKLIGELYVRTSIRLNFSVVRYAGVYGKGMEKNRLISSFVRSALKNETLVIRGNGENSSDFVYIDDVIQGTMLVWQKGSYQIYNIGSGQETTIFELAKKIIQYSESDSTITLSGEKASRPFRFALDISKAQRELGYHPLSLYLGLNMYLGSMYE